MRFSRDHGQYTANTQLKTGSAGIDSLCAFMGHPKKRRDMRMYIASETRYDQMQYRRCGNSGIRLPILSLGLWHNFGDNADYENMKRMIFTAFDNGITHFDIANNYGPKPGAAERNFGRILKEELGAYRDELIISTKAAYDMWEGPYGEYGSRKHMLASLDQSLKRLELDYVDIFYMHRMDPDTPIEESMLALDQAVRSGKALLQSAIPGFRKRSPG